MIILDTNVLSALMTDDVRHGPVIRWATALPEKPVTTTINRAEILRGIALLPDGARKRGLRQYADAAFGGLRACLPFTDACADAFADVVALRKSAGRPIGTMDALVAAIAIVNKSGIATRNISDFDGLGLRLIDPWSEA